mmetsp:Transcript_40128/g.78107  ORF Transcript_40128/g.78107 Transcript_40128/m.78107 type:complete len:373 (+) Transcript_40128:105-1223(+)
MDNTQRVSEDVVHVKTDPKFEKWANVHGFCPNALPHPEKWPARPLLFRLSPGCHDVPVESVCQAWGRFEENNQSKYLGEGETAQGSLPVSTHTFKFETALFVGTGILRLPSELTGEYFKGKNRKSSILVQGKFKKKLSFRTVYTGQEFCHPVKSPGYLVTKAALSLFKTLSPSMEANIVAENDKTMLPNATHFMSPLAGTASVIQITDEKNAPKLSPTTRIVEDLTGLGGDFTDSMKKYPDMEKRIVWRRKFFQKIKNLEKYEFDTKKVWTFDFYNDKLLMDELKLAILGSKYDITKYLAGQPLRILSKIKGTEEYLWNFELWHERQTEAWDESKNNKVVINGSPRTSQELKAGWKEEAEKHQSNNSSTRST